MDEQARSSERDSGDWQKESDGSCQPDAPGNNESCGASKVNPPDSNQTKQPSSGSDSFSPEKSVREEEAVHAKHPLYVSLPVYDGPLDLLLDLIKKNEMNIYDIPIAEITRRYMETLAQMKKLDLEIAGEFLVMAATLVYIKSKMLLPQEKKEEDEEGQDPRAELVRKLLEYQAFKGAAKELGFLEGERSKMFTRQVTDYYLTDLDPEDAGIDTFSASLYDLVSAFQVVLTKAGRKNLHEVFEEQVSIDERIADIKRILLEKKRVLFSELFPASLTKNYLIATFLALLEVVRTKFVRAVQQEHYGEIVIECRESAGSNR